MIIDELTTISSELKKLTDFVIRIDGDLTGVIRTMTEGIVEQAKVIEKAVDNVIQELSETNIQPTATQVAQVASIESVQVAEPAIQSIATQPTTQDQVAPIAAPITTNVEPATQPTNQAPITVEQAIKEAIAIAGVSKDFHAKVVEIIHSYGASKISEIKDLDAFIKEVRKICDVEF